MNNKIRQFSYRDLPKRVYAVEEKVKEIEGGGDVTVSWGDIEGKPTEFNPSYHSHHWADINGLGYALSFKASIDHTHTISNVTGLQGALNSKANTNDLSTVATSGNYNDLSNKPAILTIGTTATTAKAGNYVPTWSEVTSKPATFTPSAHTHVWADITDKPTTFTPTIGTTATTAKAGNYVPTWAEVTGKPTTFAPAAHTHAWVDITAKPAVIASGATQAEARTAIGAGTGNSNLAIGTTASTAKAGNYTPSATEVVNALNAMTPEQIGEIQTLLGITPA